MLLGGFQLRTVLFQLLLRGFQFRLFLFQLCLGFLQRFLTAFQLRFPRIEFLQPFLYALALLNIFFLRCCEVFQQTYAEHQDKNQQQGRHHIGITDPAASASAAAAALILVFIASHASETPFD